MTIAGSVYVASLCFLVMGCWYPYLDSESLAKLFQPYLTYVAVAAVALSYIFGFIFHRFIQILISLGTHLRKHHSMKGYFADTKKEIEQRLGNENLIWEFGATRVQREVDFQFAQLALLRSLAVSVFCLLFSITVWRLRDGQGFWSYTNWIFFIAFYIVLCCAHVRQKFQNETIIQNAFDAAEKVRDRCSRSPSDAIVSLKGIRFGQSDGNCTVTFDGLKIDPPLVQITKLVPSLSPISGRVGTDVTITGINFGKPQGHSSVTFNETVGVPKTWESTHIVVPVPDGVLKKDSPTEGNIAVTVKVLVQGMEGDQSFTLQMTCPPFTLTR